MLLLFYCFFVSASKRKKALVSSFMVGFSLFSIPSPNADTRPESDTKNTPEEVTEKQKTIEDSEKTSR